MTQALTRFVEEYGPEIVCDKDGPCTLLNAAATLTAATANQNMVTGVAGKKVRVVSANFYSGGAASTCYLHSSGGAGHLNVQVPANTVAEPNVIYNENKYGWANGTTAENLQGDAGAVAVAYSITYYHYTP